jgi:hypothetical protein
MSYMSEKAPGQYPLTPAELETLNRQDQEKIDEANLRLDELAQSVGYARVTTFDELGLTPEQIESFGYKVHNDKRPSARYYMATRKDGVIAKVIVQARSDGCYFAEFFSPMSHGFNHDFSLSEMQGNMENHLKIGKDGNPI